MEQLIDLETAKLAKEKGFNQPTENNYFLKYPENGKLKNIKIILDDNDWVYSLYFQFEHCVKRLSL